MYFYNTLNILPRSNKHTITFMCKEAIVTALKPPLAFASAADFSHHQTPCPMKSRMFQCRCLRYLSSTHCFEKNSYRQLSSVERSPDGDDPVSQRLLEPSCRWPSCRSVRPGLVRPAPLLTKWSPGADRAGCEGKGGGCPTASPKLDGFLASR